MRHAALKVSWTETCCPLQTLTAWTSVTTGALLPLIAHELLYGIAAALLAASALAISIVRAK